MHGGETGFKCPECGQGEGFTADSVVLYNARVSIGPDGWDYWSSGGDVELAEGAVIECDECGHRGPASAFEME